ncbi:phosphosulfolactate synthase [Desulfofundulus thermobenzoicus]|uniref:Phosphosulfolactate synthase n=1 Tax=Desulfofundulus thermobenzoicus TaxID=29376 RepID=A0A6N7IU20_9FIRM|nr:phosphosulfolactate synthase [Desulfofundulus thermobenzoicus]MQL52947.1 phosphosulfolactate synthase [Desulfofundulus thermobenzoicus]HHW45096.1 phosphosulfolactate synthase [Desulfotomaculum sp.]
MHAQATILSWPDFLQFPLGRRMPKPRQQGLTMIIDKGLGLAETKDILHVCGQYIDFYKLGFGTAALYAPEVLEEKVQLVKSFAMDVYPGGTFLEVAIIQEKLEEFLYLARHLGFTAIEVSDGTINMSDEVRDRAIATAAGMGFKVLTEVGKKDIHCPIQEIIRQIHRDLQNGAYRVIMEGRESGMNVGIYDEKGQFIRDDFEELMAAIGDPRVLIWEAPLKDQQQELILRFGPNVNLGNIPPREVLAVEALRVGLRADTFKATLCDGTV